MVTAEGSRWRRVGRRLFTREPDDAFRARGRIWWKLAAIALVFMVPLGIDSYLLLQEKEIKIDFAASELKGTEYLRPLAELLVDIDAHRTLVRRQLSGASAEEQIAEVEQRVDTSFRSLMTLDRELGDDLKTSLEDMQAREREAALPSTLRREWADLRDGPASLEASESAHGELLAGIRMLITHVGDTSELILDPDLDTYYVMDALLLREPELIDRLSSLRDTVDRLRAVPALSLPDRASVSADLALINAANDGLRTDIATAVNTTGDFNENDQLESVLAPAEARSFGAVARVLTLTRQSVVESPTITVSPADYDIAVETAIDTNHELWQKLFEQEARMLHHRRDGDLDRRRNDFARLMVALAITAVVIVIIARRISGDVRRVATAAQRVAAGDLDQRAEVRSRDEIGAMAEAFNTMVDSLVALVAEVRGAGASLVAASAQLSASSEQLAATTTEQSAAVTETSATAEELARASSSIADRVDQVAVQAAETRESLEQADHDLQVSSERTLALAGRVGEINSILELINDIADQTNLLALNAAIEAARAGEGGRGFAVVADEVRRLAERSKTSAGHIAELIEGIQAESNATVMAMETGAKQMQRGLASLEDVTDAAAQVRLTTQQQRSATAQVVETMEQLSDASRQVADTAQQIADAAGSLTAMAGALERTAAAASARG